MAPLTLLFFSSSPIALALFEKLLADPRFKILGLVCQPDREAGRGQEKTAPATKISAEKHGVPVFQPEKLSEANDLLAQFQSERPDFILTFAYGQIFNEAWLGLAKREPLNVHPSLLPRYRGAAPIEAALLYGDHETGITLMRMVKAMDAGAIAFQHSFVIPEGYTAGVLHEEVARRAAEWIPDDLAAIGSDEQFPFVEQNQELATVCSKLSKELSFEDFQRDSETLLRRYAAYTPWPGLWTTFQGKRVKLLSLQGSDQRLKPGLVEAIDGHIFVGTLSAAVELLELQMEGKNKNLASEFVKGSPSFISSVLPS